MSIICQSQRQKEGKVVQHNEQTTPQEGTARGSFHFDISSPDSDSISFILAAGYLSTHARYLCKPFPILDSRAPPFCAWLATGVWRSQSRAPVFLVFFGIVKLSRNWKHMIYFVFIITKTFRDNFSSFWIKTLVTLGDRSFEVAAPTLWNSLPVEVRNASNVQLFKRMLKTWFFRKAFCSMVL